MAHPMKRIRKAVLPVAGLGTRFLPATKAVPKEMLCVVDRPVVQHVVDEARAAGIEHFIFVTGRNKAVIEDHFDIAYELNRTLESRNKTKELDLLAKDQPQAGQTSFTRQQDRKSTRLNSSHANISSAVFCLQKQTRSLPRGRATARPQGRPERARRPRARSRNPRRRSAGGRAPKDRRQQLSTPVTRRYPIHP